VTDEDAPLGGVKIVDLSRMLPGAVLARSLLDLGARLVKVEDPRGGDPMRHSPPVVDGLSTGFRACFRGAQSVALDLREQHDVSIARQLLGWADVVVESFRPGTLGRFGLDPQTLCREHPRLIVCSLPGFWPTPETHGTPQSTSVGHDLNFVASSGLLERLRLDTVPGVQIADVTAGLLATTAVLAALLRRDRTGRGAHLVQPLQTGPLPFLLWPWADLAATGAIGTTDTLIGGRIPAYRLYACADGAKLAVGCLEPKFWLRFCEAVGRPELAGAGLDTGQGGQTAHERMAEHLAGASSTHWLRCVAGLDLPVTRAASLEAAVDDPSMRGLLEPAPASTDANATIPGPFVPSLGRTPRRPAPRLGQDTDAVLHELDLRPIV
jgi:crotonobetainyl-CoA:carnitine CoA-transferase CaiB-like acyl-CoA transferase